MLTIRRSIMSTTAGPSNVRRTSSGDIASDDSVGAVQRGGRNAEESESELSELEESGSDEYVEGDGQESEGVSGESDDDSGSEGDVSKDVEGDDGEGVGGEDGMSNYIDRLHDGADSQ